VNIYAPATSRQSHVLLEIECLQKVACEPVHQRTFSQFQLSSAVVQAVAPFFPRMEELPRSTGSIYSFGLRNLYRISNSSSTTLSGKFVPFAFGKMLSARVLYRFEEDLLGLQVISNPMEELGKIAATISYILHLQEEWLDPMGSNVDDVVEVGIVNSISKATLRSGSEKYTRSRFLLYMRSKMLLWTSMTFDRVAGPAQ
jgi:hypothetical protein